MASNSNQQGATEGSSGVIGQWIDTLLQYGDNASNNFQESFSRMTAKHWLRLICVVGGYVLLRPYVLKMAANHAMKEMEKQQDKEKEQEKQKAKISPNDLRGVSDVLDEQEADDAGDGTSADWGQKARLRQRNVVRQLLEAEEERRLEEEDDKFIADLLTD